MRLVITQNNTFSADFLEPSKASCSSQWYYIIYFYKEHFSIWYFLICQFVNKHIIGSPY